MRLLIFALAGIVVASCSTTQQAGVALQSAWIGRNADDFFKAYGPPASEFVLGDGGKIYEWIGGRTSIGIPASASTTTTFVGNTAISNTQIAGVGILIWAAK
jgi:hypothetical protein